MRQAWYIAVIAGMGLLHGPVWGADADAPETPAAEAPAAEQPSLEDRVREILTTIPEDADTGDSVRCLRSTDYRRVQILDRQRLVFHGRGSKRWLNQLRMPCPGLRRNDTLAFEAHSTRLCQHDGFRSIDPTGYGGPRSGICSLGPFEPVTEEQVQMLEDALRAEREARRSSN
jgi:hypothetical protein